MKIDDLILDLRDMVNAAKPVPFSGGKVMVDTEEVLRILDELEDAMPSEIRQAKNVVADRKTILAEAKREAESTIRSAEERKKSILNQNELVREAQIKAKEIIEDSRAKSKEIRNAANVYSDGVLKTAEETLASQLEIIKSTRAKLNDSHKASNKE